MSDWFTDFSKNSKEAYKRKQEKIKKSFHEFKKKIPKTKDDFKKIFKLKQHEELEETKEYRDDIRRRALSFQNLNLLQQDQEVDNELLLCPISQELMTDPVMTPYGHCFQRSCIEAWLVKHDTCPITGQKLLADQLITCYTVKAIVEEHLSKQKQVIKFE